MGRRAQLGMAMFLIAEAVFFLLLVLAFVYFRAMPRSLGPFAWLFTAVIALSSITMWRASVGSSLWVCTTVALGIAFVIGQATVYHGTFLTLAAIHALHVLAGSIALAFVPASALRAMAIYWYFFTAVWLAIFITASQI